MSASPLDLEAILARSESAYESVRSAAEASGSFPDGDVRDHFNYDVPALIGTIRGLRAAMEASS